MENSIKILGAFGSKTHCSAMTCIQIDNDIVIDAGNILLGLGEKAKNINHIFLTHSHMDHLVDIPFLIDVYFNDRITSLNIYGTHDTLNNLQNNILNWKIWPNFTQIQLYNSKDMAIKLIPINLNTDIKINNLKLKAIKTNHTVGSCGYVVEKNNNALFFTSDTSNSNRIWEEVNNNTKIKSIIIDVSFPCKYKQLAINSKHLTLELLKKDLQNLNRDDVRIYINHLKPSFIQEIKDELETTYINILNGGKIILDGDIINIKTLEIKSFLTQNELNKQHISQLIEIGQSLTSERNSDILMEKILLGAKQLSNADGGTLYIIDDISKSLSFKVVQTDSLGIKMGGTSGKIVWPSIELYNENGHKNKKHVAALCALEGELINITDVYEADGFNFEGTKKFDKGTGYRTKSMLVVPMRNHENKIVGVLQLLNKLDAHEKIDNFSKDDEKLILSMSSQAVISITNIKLIEDLEKLLLGFIKSTADAISEKSKYTGGHISRVSELSTLIAEKINEDTTGIFKDTNFSNDELKQINIAAWMHDIGKITTPEYIVDKATKLETKYDRINEINAKFEIAKRDVEIKYLKNCLDNNHSNSIQLEKKYKEDIKKLDNDMIFIQNSNFGLEYTPKDDIDRIKQIASLKLQINNKNTELLNNDELYNLSIQKGTLTAEERTIINNHVVVSYNMLKNLSFPDKLKRVPIIASSHHKTIYTDDNGRHGGYGADEIMNEPMSIEDRILAIADVFEAITASDRPYKEPNSLNQSLKIISFMVKDKELDKDIVKFFIENKIYEDYAYDNLLPSQIDEVTVKI
jgi:HD-GYP domain-containing protein (c-di-GMP phosphodiesterase class II)